MGYSRDGKRGKLQITYGLCCSPEGCPVSVQVHAGNSADPSTLQSAVERVKERFGIKRVVFVGDRGMITEARVKALTEQDVGFITALRAPQIQALTLAPSFQLALFEERGLGEVSSPEHPGERLVICRNPAVAAERTPQAQALLGLTEADLEKVRESVHEPRGRLKNATAGTIGQRAGRVVGKRKMAKQFTLKIEDRSFSYERNTAQIEEEALLDGIYVIRTLRAHLKDRLRGARARLQAAQGQRARVQVDENPARDPPHPPPSRDRVRAHVFLCMLAYHVQHELTARLAPMLPPTTPRSPQPTPSRPRSAHHAPTPKPPAPTPPTGSPPTASPICSRARHAVSQQAAHRPQPAHLHPPDHPTHLQAHALEHHAVDRRASSPAVRCARPLTAPDRPAPRCSRR